MRIAPWPVRTLLLAVLASCGTSSGTPSSGTIPIGASRSVDPDYFRPQIVTIDRIVYDTGMVSETDRGELADELDHLANRITRGDPSPVTATLSQNLRQLARGVRERSLDRIRIQGNLSREWERIRASLFADASWWRHSAQDPIASIEPDRPHRSRVSPAARFEQDQLERAVRNLEDAADDGDRDIAGSPVTPVTDASTRARDSAWQVTVREWQARLAKLSGELPPAPAPVGDAIYAAAYRETSAAVTSLRNASGTWMPSGRQQWIADAHTHLREARRYLAQVGR
jgi:hypothetical protein